MDSVSKDKVNRVGCHQDIRITAEYDDPDASKMKHSVMWEFVPHPDGLLVPSFLHKKFYEQVTVDPTSFTQDDGSEIIEMYCWEPIHPTAVPHKVWDFVRELLGDKLVTTTLSADTPSSYKIPKLTNIPQSSSISCDTFEVLIDAQYSETFDEGTITHYCVWEFEPDTSNTPRLQVSKCVHKTCFGTATTAYSDDNPGEQIIELLEGDATPPISELPSTVISRLQTLFGPSSISGVHQ